MRSRPAVLIVVLASILSAAAARREALELRHARLELSGPPSSILAADLNRDGRGDLLLVVAYTDVENIGLDRIENMVQISTVVPAVFDRREMRAYLAAPDGSLRLAGDPTPLPTSVLSVARAGDDLLALTDDGLARVLFREEAEAPLALEPVLADPPVIAGVETFFPRLEWIADADGDGDDDVLLPARDGIAIYLRQDGRIADTPAQRLRLPGDRTVEGARTFPLPELRHVDGDAHPDLITSVGRYRKIFLGNGDGTFRPAYPGRDECDVAASALRVPAPTAEKLAQLIFLGDLDGDRRAEAVFQETLDPQKDGMRANLKQIKKPLQRFRFFRLDEKLELEAEPYREAEVAGHSFSADLPTGQHQRFRDLDGDGRLDLIAITLDFSVFQALKVLATKRIGIGLDFHVWAQEADGSFREVKGLDLSEKLKLNLKRMNVGRMAQFSGDFDGDGRVDFVHFGRGRKVTIHRGQEGCRYADSPDLVIELERELPDLGLVRVEDFDGDGRADFWVQRPEEAERADVSPPVLLDLYLSGGTP